MNVIYYDLIIVLLRVIMIFRVIFRSRVTFSIIITIVLLTCILTPYRAVIAHFDTVKALAEEYIPKSEYYISYDSGDVRVDVYRGYVNGTLVIYLQTSNITMFLDSLGIKAFGNYSIVIGSDLIKFVKAEKLCIEIFNSTLIIDLRDKHVSTISGVYSNYIISSLIIAQDIKPAYTFFVNKASSTYPINNAELFVNDLSASYTELVRTWSIPIYILILACTLINSLRLSRSINDDIKRLTMIGAKRKVLLLHLLLATIIILLLSSTIGISLGYILSQIIARVIYWASGTLIIPIININTYIELLALSFISSAIGAAVPLYISISRCSYV